MDTDVLVVGGGPVGLTAALELRRRGIDVIVVDRLTTPAPIAKAVGIQPRTVELWDSVGIARRALDAATTLRGMIGYVNGAETSRLDVRLPDTVPYQFAALPQYETERVLAEALADLGTYVRRGTEFVRLTQDETGVNAILRDAGGESTIRSKYLVGCDGAHSTVRAELGLTFEGDAFPEEYMLADVEVDWDLPPGYSIRASHVTDGTTDDLLVCIPLPGHKRYRMSMFVPPDLSSAPSDAVGHGLESGRAPQLRHIQAVLDRLSPQPATAANMRWSSVFRISHRIVDRYAVGRVFVAGDAAHIHPPTGAQGMNTGVQDAFNLGWKLALAVQGKAADGLLGSYNDERLPVGEEVVGRTVRAARSTTGVSGGDDLATILAREAQLLVAYPDSPLVADDVPDGVMAGGPAAGSRAPDARGLRQDTVSSPIRLHELFRHVGHTLLLWAGDAEAIAGELGELVRCYVIVGGEIAEASGAVFRDGNGEFAAAYGTGEVAAAAYLVRPDGYISYRSSSPTAAKLRDHMSRTLA